MKTETMLGRKRQSTEEWKWISNLDYCQIKLVFEFLPDSILTLIQQTNMATLHLYTQV